MFPPFTPFYPSPFTPFHPYFFTPFLQPSPPYHPSSPLPSIFPPSLPSIFQLSLSSIPPSSSTRIDYLLDYAERGKSKGIFNDFILLVWVVLTTVSLQSNLTILTNCGSSSGAKIYRKSKPLRTLRVQN